jgi:hypothetical protein
MPLTDSKGQNVPYPVLTDKPNARSFGENMVEAFADKLVMRFASASVRGATITSPKPGMMAWLDDVQRMEVYTGSRWDSVANGTSVWHTPSLASPWVSPPPLHNDNPGNLFQYRKVDLFGAPTLFFQGEVQRGDPLSYPANPLNPYVIHVIQQPDHRPSVNRTINIPCSDAGSTRISLKCDITTTGEIQIWGLSSVDKPWWIGFNGCFVTL